MAKRRWEKLQEALCGPGKREGHTCNSVGSFLYVYGGTLGEDNQVHVFDTATRTWTQPTIKGPPPPPARDEHTCTTVGENLYIFGGLDRDVVPLGDLHIFNTVSHTWTSPSHTGDRPRARYGHGAALIGTSLFVFGGCGLSDIRLLDVHDKDLYELNTETFVWKRVVTWGNPPDARQGHTCSSWNSRMIVIGGKNKGGHCLSDVLVFNAETLLWGELITTGQKISPRYSHSTVVMGKHLFVFGGILDTTENMDNDLYLLDLESDIWSKVVTTGDVPSARFSAAGNCLDLAENGVLVFFGGSNNTEEVLGDMYYLHTPANQRVAAHGDDVVIVAAYRTPLCKTKRGGLKDTLPDELLATVLKALIERTNLNPGEVGDIVVGTVLAPGSDRAMECRIAAFYAGFPDTVPLRTVNRQCSSGLQAVADVVAAIKAGFYEIGIAAGVEAMSLDAIGGVVQASPKVEAFAQAQDCLLPMGITSENVAERYDVTRQEQDQAAVNSHRKAAAATASGKFKDEIIPVLTKIVDPSTGKETAVTISADDGIRPDTNLEGLAKLRPEFKKDGSTTAGNASQLTDGAGAVLLMKRGLAMQKGLPILGVFRSFAAVGVDPAVMGIGPAAAIPVAVKNAGLEVTDIDLFEINEAFASQYVYCCKKLELNSEIVNVNGGAIALGHPLGATGARCVATLLHEMKRRGTDCRFGVISMCIGSGMCVSNMVAGCSI